MSVNFSKITVGFPIHLGTISNNPGKNSNKNFHIGWNSGNFCILLFMEENLQHSQLPNDMLKIEDMEAKDLIVYLTIRRYLDEKTNYSKISFETAAQKLGCSEKTVRNSVAKLKKSGFLIVQKIGKYNAYTFPKCDHFERFYVDFIDNPEMTYQQKAFYAAQQQHMFKENTLCKTNYSTLAISRNLNMDFKTVKKYEKEFIDHGWMTIAPTNIIDAETGCRKMEKIYFPEKFGQAMLFIAEKHENELREHDAKIAANTENIAEMQSIIQQVIEENKSLKKDLSILKNKISEPKKENDLIV